MNILLAAGTVLAFAVGAALVLTFWYILAGSDGRYETEDEDD